MILQKKLQNLFHKHNIRCNHASLRLNPLIMEWRDLRVTGVMQGKPPLSTIEANFKKDWNPEFLFMLCFRLDVDTTHDSYRRNGT